MGENKVDDYEKKLLRLRKQRLEHKGEWLTQEVAEEYRVRASQLTDNGRQDIGERRELRIELQEKYGLLEIEAVNIINGFGIKDCVNKYHCIEHEIVNPGQKNGDFEVWLKHELKKADIKPMDEFGWEEKN